MPASPITKKLDVLPDHWVHLQKTMIPDQDTGCYWSVWFDVDHTYKRNSIIPGKYDDVSEGTAWLMWCAIGEDPSVNDSWCHAEEIDESCRNVLYAIESVYGVSFHDSIEEEEFPAMSEIRKSCGEQD